ASKAAGTAALWPAAWPVAGAVHRRRWLLRAMPRPAARPTLAAVESAAWSAPMNEPIPFPSRAMPRLRLGHLVFAVRRPERWQRLCTDMLGLPAPVANLDGSLGFQVDDAAQRLIVTEGRADDLQVLGLECPDDYALD